MSHMKRFKQFCKNKSWETILDVICLAATNLGNISLNANLSWDDLSKGHELSVKM